MKLSTEMLLLTVCQQLVKIVNDLVVEPEDVSEDTLLAFNRMKADLFDATERIDRELIECTEGDPTTYPRLVQVAPIDYHQFHYIKSLHRLEMTNRDFYKALTKLGFIEYHKAIDGQFEYYVMRGKGLEYALNVQYEEDNPWSCIYYNAKTFPQLYEMVSEVYRTGLYK